MKLLLLLFCSLVFVSCNTSVKKQHLPREEYVTIQLYFGTDFKTTIARKVVFDSTRIDIDSATLKAKRVTFVDSVYYVPVFGDTLRDKNKMPILDSNKHIQRQQGEIRVDEKWVHDFNKRITY